MSKMKIQHVSYQSAMLILWDALMYTHLHLLQELGSIIFTKHHSQGHHDIIIDIGYSLFFLLFPLFGLLADVKTGRYKTIIIGVYFSFVSWIIAGLAIILKTYINFELLFMILLGLSFFIQLIGYCSFRSNIVQFNIDQSVGASADELSAIVYWDSMSIPTVIVVSEIVQCLIEEKQFLIMCYVLSGVAVSTVIITNFLFKHWLDTIPQITNPVKLIAKVLNYARKNKYAKNRSALTYWEDDYPSRIDLGKEKYGGPFSEEEVEDVKTVFRIMPLFISIVGMYSVELFNSVNSQDLKLIDCFFSGSIVDHMVAVIVMFLHLKMAHLCVYKVIPSMLRRIGLGLGFVLSTTLYYVIIILACKVYLNINLTSYKVLVTPQVLFGISYGLIFPTSLEFTIAQSPHKMRGFMVGMWYAAFGFGYAINNFGKYPFDCKRDNNCLNLYYFIFKSVVVLIILIIFAVLAKCYKLRVRENEVNIHWITEEHYQRYMEQEVEYRKEMGLSIDSTSDINESNN